MRRFFVKNILFVIAVNVLVKPIWVLFIDRNVQNTDIVLWHSFGLHHLPRPEDHPVQPGVVCGFKLMPSGFFDQNPVIDLPRTMNTASCCS